MSKLDTVFDILEDETRLANAGTQLVYFFLGFFFSLFGFSPLLVTEVCHGLSVN